LATHVISPETPAYILNIRIDEPLTVLTDLVISATCLFAYFALRAKAKGHPAIHLMNRYFLFLGIATFLGGVLGHGFYYLLSPRWRFPGWLSGMLAVVFAELASVSLIRHKLRTRLYKVLRLLIYAELFLLVTLAFYTLDFRWVEAHSIFGLLLIFSGIHLVLLLAQPASKASMFALTGIGILLISFFIYAYKLDLFIWLPSTILAHLLMAVSIWFNYKGTTYYSPAIKGS
jgi:MFS family permease